MKLLLDQNISYRLVGKLSQKFPGIAHVSNLALANKPDRQIWEEAKRMGYTIVTFDADFYDLSLTYGFPPKVIWIRVANATTMNLEKLLISKQAQILDFGSDEVLACLEVNDD